MSNAMEPVARATVPAGTLDLRDWLAEFARRVAAMQAQRP